MNIDELTIGQVRELAGFFNQNQALKQSIVEQQSIGLNDMLGSKCIIRTYSAGVWFGEILKKSGNEVIVVNARRMWQWWAAESITLSAVAKHGINKERSKICEAVESVWLESIEIIPCTHKAIKSIEECENAKAE